ncbi:MAG: cytochrome c, partial [Chlorobiaceae bacterium]|nr:cytochrome c [Chlorobiaceae bacterium]
LREGKRLYNHYCAICHGETGDGAGQYYGSGLTPAPANFTDKAFMKTLTDETMFKAISEGSAGVGKSNMCPPWGKSFDKDEIDCMITYIRTLTGN